MYPGETAQRQREARESANERAFQEWAADKQRYIGRSQVVCLVLTQWCCEVGSDWGWHGVPGCFLAPLGVVRTNDDLNTMYLFIVYVVPLSICLM